jgi:hypothetical protein
LTKSLPPTVEAAVAIHITQTATTISEVAKTNDTPAHVCSDGQEARKGGLPKTRSFVLKNGLYVTFVLPLPTAYMLPTAVRNTQADHEITTV